MPDLLLGRIAFITGGAGGIGYSIAQRYLEEGASVVLADVALDRAATAADSLRGFAREGAGIVAVEIEVRDEVSTVAAFEAGEAALGPIDVVVANAGILFLGPAVDTPLEEWSRVIDVNLTGAFVTAKVAAARMTAAGLDKGRIIFTSSLFGVRGGVENSAYSASKWGMLGLMKCMAAELAPAGVTVNAVCPGQIRTAMIEKLSLDRAELRGTTPEQEIDRLAATIPLGYLANPLQIADAFIYLASDLSSYTTGQELIVDGGVLVG
ncbi:SDR family NAD(P)-dependent oxidoreductase [Amnibacterium flavum]|uniref:Ketoreductase domain-containing protein n=1 Tax=Amnibacterium flavum TaxID=2173173 RepID=A0A2V1HTZ7_9MICO|nr:SDR family NAD(P)-dependent oxidoreductase [Amnibacterium flavum]PVZ94519.1 hypothetical protein DDQ50_12525 [Amnibacterium flavum]